MGGGGVEELRALAVFGGSMHADRLVELVKYSTGLLLA